MDRLVHLADKRGVVRLLALCFRVDLAGNAVDPPQMLVRRLRARGRPLHIAFGRGVRQYKPPRRIRAVAFNDVQRVHDVVLGFGHLR